MEHTVSQTKFLKAEPIGNIADEDEVPKFTFEARAKLELLPDDVVLYIMKYLRSIDLVNFSKVTERFVHLIEDKNLWKKVDFQPYKIKIDELLKYVHYFKGTTKSITLRGFVSEYPNAQWREEVLTPNLMKCIAQKCPELETLILDEHFVSATGLGLELFPRTLLHLSMKECVVSNLNLRPSYFHKMSDFLPFIKVLVLSNCTWVMPHDIMPISKCINLEELRLDGCPQLEDCMIYGSVAARFGFYSLKILDLRNTRMGDRDVECFIWCRNLTHLYLQCPPTRYICRGLCDDPTCVDPDDDYFSFTDDEDCSGELDDNCDLHPINSQPSPSRNSENTLENLNEARSDACNASTSTSSASLVRNENSNSNFQRASTSQAAGHSADLTAHLLNEQCSEDSYSSSDENNTMCLSSSHSESNLHKHTITGNIAVQSQSSQISSSVSENGNRATKRRHSSSNCSQNTENLGTSNSTIPTCMSTDSCQNESKHLQQETDDVHIRKLQTVSDHSSSGAEETMFKRQSFEFNELVFPRHNRKRVLSSTLRRRSRIPLARPQSRETPQCKFGIQHLLPSPEPFSESMISDLCIMSLVLNGDETVSGYVKISSPYMPIARPHLHTLVVKDFRMITDASLLYLVKLNSLRYLDVSGTSVTNAGVLQFKLKRPDVEVVSDHANLPI